MNQTANPKVHRIGHNYGDDHVVSPALQMHLLRSEIVKEIADKITGSVLQAAAARIVLIFGHGALRDESELAEHAVCYQNPFTWKSE